MRRKKEGEGGRNHNNSIMQETTVLAVTQNILCTVRKSMHDRGHEKHILELNIYPHNIHLIYVQISCL